MGKVLIPSALLAGYAVLLVGSDVLERHLIPEVSIGWRHALLTVRAALVTVIGCTAVYLLMRRHQRRLTRATEQLSRFLASYRTPKGVLARFDNPHLRHCRDVRKCRRTSCPMYTRPDERCWQIMALRRSDGTDGGPRIPIQRCHRCAVYRAACPDRLTELGEHLNNMMFLLEEEAHQVGHMRAQMAEREKMAAIGQMAAGFAHEVGNPLSSISSIVQVLRRRKNGAPRDEQLELILTHIRRISDTVHRMSSIARPRAERWAPVDVGQLLDEAVQLIRFDPRARSIHVDYRPNGKMPRTRGVADQLQQVFINLLLNSLDAMPDGGTLTVRVQRRRGAITVRIQDTGCGIPSALHHRIFEPFFSSKPAGRGTGLGLTVSRGIVKKHGGTLSFDSTPNVGSAFTVLIPIANKTAELFHEPNHHPAR